MKTEISYIGQDNQFYKTIKDLLTLHCYSMKLDELGNLLRPRYRDHVFIHADFLEDDITDETLDQLSQSESPIILLCLPGDGPFLADVSKKTNVSTMVLSEAFDPLSIVYAIKRLCAIGQRKKEMSVYINIEIAELLVQRVLPSDVYLKMSDDKYLLLFKAGHTFGYDEVTAVANKYNNTLFVKQGDYEVHAANYAKVMSQYLENNSRNVKRLYRISSTALNIGKKQLVHFGLKEGMLEQVDLAVDCGLKLIRNNPDIMLMLEDFLSRNNFFAQHSILAGILSGIVAKEMTWGTQNVLENFLMAGFFHDIISEREEFELENIVDFGERHKEQDKEYMPFYQHPVKAFSLLERVEGLHPSVKDMILHHHEMPDGNGFPNKLRHQALPVSSAIFNFCHYFVIELYKTNAGSKGFSPSLEKTSALYNKGEFITIKKHFINAIKPATDNQ